MNYLWQSARITCFYLQRIPLILRRGELGWGPDHYLTNRSAVSQSHLNKWPSLNLWLCSSSLVRSQTLGGDSSCVWGCRPTTHTRFQNLRTSARSYSEMHPSINYLHPLDLWGSQGELGAILLTLFTLDGSLTYRDKQPLMLTFTPPINLRPRSDLVLTSILRDPNTSGRCQVP